MFGAGGRSHCQGSFSSVGSVPCPQDVLNTACGGRLASCDDLRSERKMSSEFVEIIWIKLDVLAGSLMSGLKCRLVR